MRPYAGVDTFRISCWVQFRTNHGDFPHELFLSAVRARQEELRAGKATTGTLDFRGEIVSVNRSGSTKGDDGKKGPFYPHVLNWRGIRFEMNPFPEATKTTANVIVYVPSMPLTAKRGEWRAVWDEARWFLETLLFGTVSRTAVGRLDVFADMPEQTVSGYFKLLMGGCFIRRARSLSFDGSMRKLDAKLVRSYLEAAKKEFRVRMMGKGFDPTGFYLGSAGVICRVYDKLREMEDKEDVIKFQAMQAAYWGGGVPKELTRIEFQMGSRELRQAGITDVRDLGEKLADVAKWLTQSWLVVRERGVDRRVSKRSKFHPWWQAVIDATNERFGLGLRDLVPVETTPCEGERLLDQALGCLSSYIARGDFPGSPHEYLVALMRSVRQAVERRGLLKAFEEFTAKVEDHYARVAGPWTHLDRSARAGPVDVHDDVPGLVHHVGSVAAGGIVAHGSDGASGSRVDWDLVDEGTAEMGWDEVQQ